MHNCLIQTAKVISNPFARKNSITNYISIISKNCFGFLVDTYDEEISKNPAKKFITFETEEVTTGYDEEGKPIKEKKIKRVEHLIPNPLIDQRKSTEGVLKQYTDRKVLLQNRKLETDKIVREEYESSSTGFLQELEILFTRIIFVKWIAGAFYVFLFLFLMLLELLVVMSKGGDGDSDYDLIVQHQQRIKAETLKRMEEGLLAKK